MFERRADILMVGGGLGGIAAALAAAVEWDAGETAGHLAAFSAVRRTLPRAVHASPEDTAELQRELAAAGVELRWPPEIRDRR